jgi:hypothetical protein
MEPTKFTVARLDASNGAVAATYTYGSRAKADACFDDLVAKRRPGIIKMTAWGDGSPPTVLRRHDGG